MSTHDLAQLQGAPGLDVSDPSLLLQVLAGAAGEDRSTVLHAAAARLSELDGRAAARLDALLGVTLELDPSPIGFLHTLELVGLAERGCARLAGPPAVADVLAARLQAGLARVRSLPSAWELGSLAETRMAALGGPAEPWSSLPLGLPASPEVAVCEAWLDKRLSASTGAALGAAVVADGAWRDAYQQALQDRTGTVALDASPYPVASTRWRLALPHAAVALELAWDERLSAWGPGLRGGGVDPTTPLRWGDAVTGSRESWIDLTVPDARDAFEAAVAELEAADGAAGEPLRAALYEALAYGEPRRRLLTATAAEEEGEEPSAELTSWVLLGVRAAAALHREGRLSDSDALVGAAIAADAALAGCTRAPWILARSAYLVAAGDNVDLDAWWGARFLVEQGLGGPELLGLLAETSPPAVAAGPSAWPLFPPLHASRDLHAAGEPGDPAAVGRIRLLLVDRDRREGAVAELVVRHRPGAGAWGQNDALRVFAWRSIADAYAHASRLTPQGIGRWAFEDHEVVITSTRSRFLAVDGDSLMLPVALAFLSLWTDQALPEGLTATGRLARPRDSGPSVVLPVGYLSEKLEALADSSGTVRPWALVPAPPEGAPPLQASALVALRAVATLADGASVAGLDLAACPPWHGSVTDRLKRLRDLASDVQLSNQHHHATVRGLNAWFFLADSIRLLADSLHGEPSVHAKYLDEALLAAALAYTHAGELREADAALAGVREQQRLPVALRVVRGVVRLGLAIDADDPTQTDAEDMELAALMDRLDDEDDRRHYAGIAAGARGRARMHAGRLDEALALLRDALAWNTEHLPHEAARSGVYLAMALRMRGDLDEAATVLAAAEVALDRHVRTRLSSYASACEIYLRYERARLALVRGAPQDAAEDAAVALSMCGSDWWPAAGLLRVEAVALRTLGDVAGADGALHALHRLVVPPPWRELVDRLSDEARAGVVAGGVVY